MVFMVDLSKIPKEVQRKITIKFLVWSVIGALLFTFSLEWWFVLGYCLSPFLFPTVQKIVKTEFNLNIED